MLGRRLRPYCLWHRFLLETVESAILKPGVEITPVEMKRAVEICTLRFRENPPAQPVTFREHLRMARAGLGREMDAFNAYVRDFTSRPDYTIKMPGRPMPGRGGSLTGAAPHTWRMVSELIGWSHWPAEVCWELPVSEVEWYLAALEAERCRMMGCVQDFLTPADRIFQAALKEKQARERAEKVSGSKFRVSGSAASPKPGDTPPETRNQKQETSPDARV